MKLTLTLTSTAATILAGVTLAAIFSTTAAFQTPTSTPVVASAQTPQIASVTVTAKRMSTEQKLAFDHENQGIQTVVISTKRLSPEQKLAMAQEDQAMQAALVRKFARNQKNG